MMFNASRRAYDRYMGRYSDQLAHGLIGFVGAPAAGRVLDVGCGPGALTEALAALVGSERVSAVDPSSALLNACAERVPGVDARATGATDLPWQADTFDLVLSQLVLNFLPDIDAAVAEMLRVTRPGGVVGACTWDYREGMQMLRAFWDAASELDPDAPDEGATMRWCTEAELESLWSGIPLSDVRTGVLEVSATYADFDDYWHPFTEGVGPGGTYCASLGPREQARLRSDCRRRLGSPDGPFILNARAFAVRGTVS